MSPARIPTGDIAQVAPAPMALPAPRPTPDTEDGAGVIPTRTWTAAPSPSLDLENGDPQALHAGADFSGSISQIHVAADGDDEP
jgi:hypothetical protein